MHQIQMTIGRKSYQVTLPGSWAELPEGIWSDLYSCILEEENFFNRRLIGLLLRDRRKRKLSKRTINKIPSPYLGQFFDCLTWMASKKMDQPHKPSIQIEGTVYFLPGPAFQNMTIIEFAFLDMAWQLRTWYQSQSQQVEAENWLLRMFAYICRPADKTRKQKNPDTYDGDIRQKFNSALAEENWEVMRQMNPSDQMWILNFILGCKETIAKRFPIIWDQSETDYREALAKASNRKPQPSRWLDLCRKLAGGKFGNLEETWFTGLYLVLEEVSDQIKARRKRERDLIAQKMRKR